MRDEYCECDHKRKSHNANGRGFCMHYISADKRICPCNWFRKAKKAESAKLPFRDSLTRNGA